MTVIGIDPGPESSSYVLWDGGLVIEHGDAGNHDLLQSLEMPARCFNIVPPDHCAIEQMRGFGIMASDGMFDTCAWSGRFLQAFGEERTTWMPRKAVAKHVCGSGGISHDKFIREALITRFGGKEAIGSKKAPGPLYGIAGHKWAALAIAVTWWDLNATAKERTA